jgi:hypothetical protein
VLGDAPEVHVVAGVHLGEERAEGVERTEERAVEEQHLVVLRHPGGSELGHRLLVGPDVEPDVLALPDLVGDPFESRARTDVQRSVGHDEDVLDVWSQV